MEFSHASTSGGLRGSQERLNVNYGELMDISDYFSERGFELEVRGSKAKGGEWLQKHVRLLTDLEAVRTMKLKENFMIPAQEYQHGAGTGLDTVACLLRDVYMMCEDAEGKAAQNRAESASMGIGTYSTDNPSFAEEYYAGVAAAAAAEEQARKEAEEEEARKKAEEESMLALMATLFPESYAAYQDRLTEAQMLELMEYYRERDPEMYAKLKKEYDAWKKAKAEAEKAGAAAGSGEGQGFDGVGGSGGGIGGGDFGGGGGDFGGGGGLGDLGSDWGSDDFASDLLDDNLDGEEFAEASDALSDVLGGAADDAVSAGMDAASDLADVGDGGGVFGRYGDQLASVVEAYGLRAAAALGGVAVLYATREQTTEAVAHVAEFVSTKCKPAVGDVMDQVRSAAKKTRVNLSNAKSNVTAAARGERAGDLIG